MIILEDMLFVAVLLTLLVVVTGVLKDLANKTTKKRPVTPPPAPAPAGYLTREAKEFYETSKLPCCDNELYTKIASNPGASYCIDICCNECGSVWRINPEQKEITLVSAGSPAQNTPRPESDPEPKFGL